MRFFLLQLEISNFSRETSVFNLKKREIIVYILYVDDTLNCVNARESLMKEDIDVK